MLPRNICLQQCLSHWPNEEDLDRHIVDIFSDRIQTNRQFGRDNFFFLPSTWFQVEKN